ncbi:DUF4232 domain-containing protein [Kitasatospora sp. NPDC054768]
MRPGRITAQTPVVRAAHRPEHRTDTAPTRAPKGHGRTETSPAVHFQGPSGNESVGAGSNPSLPVKGLYIDDSLKVTCWQQIMDDAVTW